MFVICESFHTKFIFVCSARSLPRGKNQKGATLGYSLALLAIINLPRDKCSCLCSLFVTDARMNKQKCLSLVSIFKLNLNLWVVSGAYLRGDNQIGAPHVYTPDFLMNISLPRDKHSSLYGLFDADAHANKRER